VIGRVQQRAKLLASLLEERCASLPHVGDVRQIGLMAGLELVRDRKRREPYPPVDRIGHRVIAEARNRAVILRPLGNVIVLMPPLSIEERELDQLVGVVRESIEAVTSGRGTEERRTAARA
jgi:adenosylmethionine-8-amino-7-oxononanoate aminotransferase